MKLYVSPSSETAWKLQPDLFSASLVGSFPDVKIKYLHPESHASVLEWTCDFRGGSITGWLDRELNTFVLDGDVRQCAEFAVWLRKLVPKEQELVYYDEGYSVDGELNHTTSCSDIAARFMSGQSR